MDYFKRVLLSAATSLLFFNLSVAQSYTERLDRIDVQHYTLNLSVNDSTDVIEGVAELEINFLKSVREFSLDLTSQDPEGAGMTVSSVRAQGKEVPFDHTDDVLTIFGDEKAGTTSTFSIKYSGVPADGLVIGTNKFGDRTFFGDNWPNRAHHWFPSVDHPSDKAFFTFIVDAPNYYQVVANGELKEEINLSNDITRYEWETTVPLPTKVAVIGVARFAVQNVKEIKGIEVSTWVYPQNADEGFFDYEPAAEILNFFIEYVGPYPYKKLANVQSKTRFGGMENASNIFYFENSVNGEQSVNSLLAHEIAHQWFGNSASEIDWAHLWLSEGFATYMTNLYIQQNKGEEEFRDQLREQRLSVIEFYHQKPSPVVNMTETNYMELLNANSYQKGGWFLHMLRNRIGDELFHRTISTYYDAYKLSNASTQDFRVIAEQVSGADLRAFFDQWLYKVGHPELRVSHQTSGEKLSITVAQVQETATVFEFSLEVELRYADGTSEIRTINVTQKMQQFECEIPSTPTDFILDPKVTLLFEESK